MFYAVDTAIFAFQLRCGSAMPAVPQQDCV